MTHKICDACETVAHCSNHGCVPLQPAQQKPLRSISEEQDAFEKVFKLPEGITRFDGGYAPTSYSAWSAQQQCYRWEGWKARAMIVYPQPAHQKPLTEREINALCPQFEDSMRREMWIAGFKVAHNIRS